MKGNEDTKHGASVWCWSVGRLQNGYIDSFVTLFKAILPRHFSSSTFFLCVLYVVVCMSFSGLRFEDGYGGAGLCTAVRVARL